MANSEVKTPNAPEEIPPYVLDHAPLIHLHPTDPYSPSSIFSHIQHTRPQTTFTNTTILSPPLTLSNLDQLNGNGTNGGTDVYLTSNDDVTTHPKWLEGIKFGTDGGTGEGDGDERKTGVIIVVEKGDIDWSRKKEGKVVDVFYFYFCSFNWGGVVLGNQLGDHVGDWEHNMIRFINGEPKYVWFSQHANGEAFTFSALQKDKSGKRPIVYSANGSHALYPTLGLHDHTLPNLNLPVPILLVDETDAGPIYDPLLSSFHYKYTQAPSPIFTSYNNEDPTGFLNFNGRWGDQEYPDNDKRQKQLAGNKKFVGGPTGPADKQLLRTEIWPEGGWSKGQRIRKTLEVGGFEFGKILGKLKCFGKRRKVKKVLVSGEEIK